MKFSEFRLLAAFFLLFAIQSCKRDEPTTWQPDVRAPLAYGKLTLDQLLVDSIFEVDNEGLWHVIVDQDLTDFDLDSLVEIADTTIVKLYPIYTFGSITQGLTLVLPTPQQVTLNHPTAQLKSIRMKGGKLKYKIQSPIEGYLNCTVSLPGLTLNGVPQSIYLQTTPPPVNQSFSLTEGFIDLDGLELSMTGQTGVSFNRVVYQIGVVVAPDAPIPASVSLGDQIRVELTFEDPQIEYARGYFGQHVFSFDEQVNFDAFASIPEAVFDLNGASTTLSLSNAVGVDAQMDFEQISNWNEAHQTEVNLQHSSLFNAINLSRAQDNGGWVNETHYTAELNSSNSNLDSFLENLPNNIRIKGDLRVNPLGNVSTSNDFIYTDNSLKADLRMDIPLRIGIQNLILSDTIALSESEQDIPVEGKLVLWVKNGFALETIADLYVLRDDGRELIANDLRLSPATSGPDLVSTIPTETWIDIPITDALLQAKDLYIEVALQTPDGAGPVGLYANQAIDFKLLVEGTYMIQYGE
jgi:hypothetical protein